MKDKDFYLTPASFELPNLGIFCFNVIEAAEFVAKILCLDGCLDKKIPDKKEGYSLDDPDLLPLLKKEINEYVEAIVSGIEKGTLRAAYISRDIHDQIDFLETFVELDELSSWFDKRGIEIFGDWFSEYMHERLEVRSAAEEAILIKEEKIRRGIKESFASPELEKIFVLERRIAELESQNSSRASKEDKLSSKERASLLKMIIGMATGGYGHDPAAVRNTTAKDIVSDLNLRGISLDEDTARKWLSEAAELLPRPADKL